MEKVANSRRQILRLGMVTMVVLALVAVYRLSAPEKATLEAKAGMAPVLPLDLAVQDTSWMGPSLMDPAAEARMPKDQGEAERLSDELQGWRRDLGSAQGARLVELHDDAYRAALALVAYYDEILARGDGPGAEAAEKNRNAMRAVAMHHASAAASMHKEPSPRAEAVYAYYYCQYVQGEQRAAALKALLALDQKILKPALRSRIKLIEAVASLDQGSLAARKKSASKALALASKISTAANVAVRLEVARAQAGLSRSGQRVYRADPVYKKTLAGAVAKAASQSSGNKEVTLRRALAIWRKAEGNKAAWDKLPFKMAAYRETATAMAVVERAALQDLSKGQHGAALRKYQALALAMVSQRARADLDLRILDIRASEYRKSQNPSAYADTLLAQTKAYQDPGILGAGQEALVKSTLATIMARHQALVDQELRLAQQQTKGAGQRQRAIAIAGAYMSMLTDNKEIERVKSAVGYAYVAGAQHREAVTIWRELEVSGSDARAYLSLAVKSQSVLAAWPASAPWQQIPAGDAAEREELLSLYGRLQSKTPGQGGWPMRSHLALLQLALGREDQAYAALSEGLKRDPVGRDAQYAAGLMLQAYTQAKRYDQVESLARLCLARHLKPLVGNQTLAPRAFLAVALLEQGRAHYAEQRYQVAVQKLGEFVQAHTDHARHDEGMLLLGQAQYGAKQYKSSIASLLDMAQRYPRSNYRQQALYLGGKWSGPMAYEENAMYFYGLLVREFGHSAEANEVRPLLIDLLLGRGLYAEASLHLWSLVRAPHLDAASKSAALFQVLEIEDRHGSSERAEQAADMLIAASDAAPDHKAGAMAVKAEIHVQKGNMAVVRRMESMLAALGSGSFRITDALGEVRYMIARSVAATAIKEDFNLELTNPTATLAERYASYKTVRQVFEAVCSGGDTSACAPAMNDLARFGEKFMASVQDIEIQQTLAKEVVAKFQGHKLYIASDVTKTSRRADAVSMNMIKKGFTAPHHTEAVLWQNSSDWFYDKVSGEAGNAYVQFATGNDKASE